MGEKMKKVKEVLIWIIIVSFFSVAAYQGGGKLHDMVYDDGYERGYNQGARDYAEYLYYKEMERSKQYRDSLIY